VIEDNAVDDVLHAVRKELCRHRSSENGWRELEALLDDQSGVVECHLVQFAGGVVMESREQTVGHRSVEDRVDLQVAEVEQRG
jgi:hypothetical protein